MDRFPNRARSDARLRVRRAPFATGACVALAVLLAACGGGGSDEPAADLDDPTQGPLAKLLGYDISPADQRAKELEVQQALVECMKAEGWEYQPVDHSSMGGGFSEEYEEQISDPGAYGEKYGYGVVRGYELQPDFDGGDFEDPNADYMNSLTMAEQQEYTAALYGEESFVESDAVDSEEATEFVMPSLEEQGCSGTAQLEVYGETPFTDPDMQERLNQLFEDSESDPAITEAYESWAVCMTERDPSYEYSSPGEIVNGFYDRLNTLQGFEPFDAEGDSSGGVIISSGSASDGLTDEQPEIDEADLEELRQDELATWADDWACQQEADLAQVRRDVEQRLADDLVAEFPELGEG
jgi:hypothetical protein